MRVGEVLCVLFSFPSFLRLLPPPILNFPLYRTGLLESTPDNVRLITLLLLVTSMSCLFPLLVFSFD
jgi:hypothetical protein